MEHGQVSCFYHGIYQVVKRHSDIDVSELYPNNEGSSPLNPGNGDHCKDALDYLREKVEKMKIEEERLPAKWERLWAEQPEQETEAAAKGGEAKEEEEEGEEAPPEPLPLPESFSKALENLVVIELFSEPVEVEAEGDLSLILEYTIISPDEAPTIEVTDVVVATTVEKQPSAPKSTRILEASTLAPKFAPTSAVKGKGLRKGAKRGRKPRRGSGRGCRGEAFSSRWRLKGLWFSR